MIKITCLNDLRRFGISPLTGEADALSYRVLCDLTASGRRYVAETLGVRIEGFPSNWNSGDPQDPAVASILLPYDAYMWIGPVALLVSNAAHSVVELDSRQLLGMEMGESYISPQYQWSDETQEAKEIVTAQIMLKGREPMDWPSAYGKVRRVYGRPKGNGQGVAGTRNVHAFTGRAM